MIIGHKKNRDFLAAALDKNTIAHALCFVGPDEVGKRTVAMELAARALQTDPERLSAHPDYLAIEREIDEKKDRLNRDINIAQAKTVRSFISNRSWLGKMKVVVINEAETLNTEAANALLKTLEDSAEDNLIILLAVNDKLLPATVRSRCQTIEFFLIPEEEIRAGLIELGFDEKKAAEAASFAWGRPGRAINFLCDEETFGEFLTEVERIKRICGQPFYVKLKEAEDLFGDKEDAIRGRDRLKKIIDIWIMLWRGALKGAVLFGRQVPIREAAGIIDELQAARQMLGQNIHPRLLIERILLKI